MRPVIQSVGLPPERHADRVVGEMMRELAKKHANLWEAVNEAMVNSSDGSPRSQRKMEQRVLRAGALRTNLKPGKRGQYELTIYDFTGWNPGADCEIGIGDPIPEKPWIACNVTFVTSEGRGRNNVTAKSYPILFVTHHAMSRAAQRLGMRTSTHMLQATRVIWNAAMRLINEKYEEWIADPDSWRSAAPLQGWRVPLEVGDALVVLKAHPRHRSLVAATVIPKHGED